MGSLKKLGLRGWFSVLYIIYIILGLSHRDWILAPVRAHTPEKFKPRYLNMKWIDINELKAGIRIEEVIGKYIDLKSVSTGTYRGKCPFHNEKVASFTVYADSQQYHYFGCGAHGDVIRFIMEHENVNFKRAVKILKDLK